LRRIPECADAARLGARAIRSGYASIPPFPAGP